ncbi:TIGR04255 family protein [Nocardioides sp. CN2-186]|uniref:TIGR04255 family protein n=1 Tax=Nocardioides tweenelious TaxID=3156607 RepID=UPI0032B51722
MPVSLDRTLLAAPPLIVTLAQVRFEERYENTLPAVATALREPMAALDLTVVAQVHQQQILVTSESDNTPEASSQRAAAGWQFKSRDDSTVVTVMTDQATLETRNYAGWDVFAQTWHAVVAALQSTIGPQLTTRLGLRYVNRVQPRDVHTAAEWRDHDLVDPAFLGPAAGSPLSEHITTAEGRATMSFADGVDALVHHGVLAEGSGQVFVLDIDCFRQVAEAFETTAVAAAMQNLNDHSLEIFQSVIKESLRKEMLGRNEG